MSIMYVHLSYEHYKDLERQMREFNETTHKSTAGFYHKAMRLRIDDNTILEFHGPLVGGAGHHEAAEAGVGDDMPEIDALVPRRDESVEGDQWPSKEGNPYYR